MSDVPITIMLPEELVKHARALGVLSNEHLAALISADIQTQLRALADDPNVQTEIRQIEAEFSMAESDGLDPT